MKEDGAANQRSAFSLFFTLALYISNGFRLKGYLGRTHANCTENPFLNCVIFYLFNIEIITAIMPINRIYKLQRKKNIE